MIDETENDESEKSDESDDESTDEENQEEDKKLKVQLEIAAHESNKRFLNKRKEIEIVALERSLPIFQKLYEGFSYDSSYQNSVLERTSNHYTSSTLSYGEIEFREFLTLFMRLYKYGLHDDFGGKFVDIGSGSGGCVFGALLLHDFYQCVGIEIISSLHSISIQVLDKWIKKVRSLCPREKQRINIDFLLGDATAIDWSDADIVFAHWTSFDFDLISRLSLIACRMKPGSFFISLTHPLLETAQFNLLETSSIRVSWGRATVYFYQRSDRFPPGMDPDPLDTLERILREEGMNLRLK